MNIQSYLNINPQIKDNTYIHPSAQIIGNVIINQHSSVWCNAVIRADVNSITIGEFTNIQDLTMIHVSHKTLDKPNGSPTIIEDYVTIGHSCILHGCHIQHTCLIGMGSIVMDDVIIPPYTMLGAGSLITPNKILQSYKLYAGRPAVAIRDLTPKEIDYLKYSAEHYFRVKNNYSNQAGYNKS